MLEKLPEYVKQAVDILGADDIDDEAIEAAVANLVHNPMLARRLIDWIPEAFGIVLISHIGDVELPTTFQARTEKGDWISFEFNAEPIFQPALLLAQEIYHSGPRDKFSNIALRSAMVGTVNQALQAHGSIDGGKLSGPALIGIPAEVYQPQRPSFWQRIFG